MEIEHAKSAEIVSSIDYLLSRILLLLPIKSLIRFQSVSKHWLALITNPIFTHLRNPNPNPAVGLFLPPAGDHQPSDYVPFSSHESTNRKPGSSFNLRGVRVLQSCNGLLLLVSDYRYYIYNPTTNRRSELPSPDEKNGTLNDIVLGFDPVKSRYYDVVCIWCTNNSQFLIQIYSSETRSWGSCVGPFATRMVDFDNGVYWNGAIHWLGMRERDESLYFRIADQVLDKMPMLPFRYDQVSRRDYFLYHSCDHLHLIGKPGSAVLFNVYEMRRDYSEWFLKYRVDLSPVVAANREMVLGHVNPFGWYVLVFSLLGLVRGEREEDSFLVLQTPGKIIRYNLVGGSFENLYEFEGDVVKGSLRYPAITGFDYIESLCCVYCCSLLILKHFLLNV